MYTGCCFFFQAEDGIRDLVRSRGLGDVYKRQLLRQMRDGVPFAGGAFIAHRPGHTAQPRPGLHCLCLLYTSDAADDLLCVDLGGRRIIKKNNTNYTTSLSITATYP